jgi:glutathione S-transferase
MILYHSPYSFNARRCVAAAKHLGLEIDLREVDLGAGAHHAPEFTALNPNKKVPVLVDGELTLWESVAILQYFAEQRPGTLLPSTAAGRADALRWQSWTLTRFQAATGVFLFENLIKAFFKMGPPDTARLEATAPEVLSCLDVLESCFAKQDYLCGAQPSVADFTLYPIFEQAPHTGLPGIRERASLSGWADRMAALPGFRA